MTTLEYLTRRAVELENENAELKQCLDDEHFKRLQQASAYTARLSELKKALGLEVHRHIDEKHTLSWITLKGMFDTDKPEDKETIEVLKSVFDIKEEEK